MAKAEKEVVLGCEAEDVITGFRGIVESRIVYLYGCDKFGIVQKTGKDGKTGETNWFDEGRCRWIGPGVNKATVTAKSGKTGGSSLPPSNLQM